MKLKLFFVIKHSTYLLTTVKIYNRTRLNYLYILYNKKRLATGIYIMYYLFDLPDEDHQ